MKVKTADDLINLIDNYNKYKGLGNRIWKKQYQNIINGITNEIRIVKRQRLHFFWCFPNRYEKHDFRMIKLLKKSKLYDVELNNVEDVENSSDIKYRHYTYKITKKENVI